MVNWERSTIDDKWQQVVGDVKYITEGPIKKSQEIAGTVKHTVDGAVGKVEHLVGSVTSKMDGVTGAITQQATTMKRDVGLARDVMTGAMHRVNSVMSSMSTSAIGTEIGGPAMSATFGIGTSVKFTPSNCLDIAKLGKDVLKIIDILNMALGVLEPGGSGPIHLATGTLGKFKVPCLSIQAGVQAAADAVVPFANLPDLAELDPPT